jgi:hypothetical protein
MLGDRTVNALCQPLEVEILCTDNDPCVSLSLHVASHEMATILRENRPTIGGGGAEDIRIGGAPVRQARFAGRHGVMTKLAQRLNRLEREFRVGEETRHLLYHPGQFA